MKTIVKEYRCDYCSFVSTNKKEMINHEKGCKLENDKTYKKELERREYINYIIKSESIKELEHRINFYSLEYLNFKLDFKVQNVKMDSISGIVKLSCNYNCATKMKRIYQSITKAHLLLINIELKYFPELNKLYTEYTELKNKNRDFLQTEEIKYNKMSDISDQILSENLNISELKNTIKEIEKKIEIFRNRRYANFLDSIDNPDLVKLEELKEKLYIKGK